MERTILVRSQGSANAELLEEKVLELKDEFSKEGVEISRGIKKSLEFGAAGTVFLTIGIGVATGLILRFIDKLLEKGKDIMNVNIQIKVEKSDVTFNLPEDKQKILDYYKHKNT